MIYRLVYSRLFDAAHHLPAHPGKCRNLHGHTWKVRVTIETDRLNDAAMVLDFGTLKAIIDGLDHGLLNDKLDVPTAENLAGYVRSRVLEALVGQSDGNPVVAVAVWESRHSMIEARG